RVRRVIKGQFAQAGLSFTFWLSLAMNAVDTDVAAGQFGMFFLRAEQPHGYVVLHPTYPFVVASPDAPAVKGSDFNRVVAQVAHVLTSTRTSLEQRGQAISVLDGVKTQAATMALREAANESDVTLQLQAVAALLRRNDISVLPIAESALLYPPQNIEPHILTRLASTLQGIENPQAIPSLARLLMANDIETRRSAAIALRKTDAREAIEPLARALEDSAREVRYQAVLGLAMITRKGKWATSSSLYERDEQRYLTYWKEWVRNRQ
ncbi:MAG TPA: HEAT repeat domain-containing protein, partial [Blastocatellia bacterium]|nr:HEAT repeat domain-containing protein [Blastocatellia bacterium]